jgi:hypothetical protein
MIESKRPIHAVETIEKLGNPEIIKRELNKRKKRKNASSRNLCN